MRLAAMIQNWGVQHLPWFPGAEAARERAAIATQGRHILVLSASIGAGHVRAAEALSASARNHGYGLPVQHLDTMQYVSPLLKKLYVDGYLFLVNRWPSAWGWLYHTTNSSRRTSAYNRLRSAVERLAAARLIKEIIARKPEAIICTHFFPAELLSHLRRTGKVECPVWVQITDFDCHSSWVHPGLSGYFAANRDVAMLLQSQGIPEQDIRITGIPIMPAFGQPLDRRECAAALGLDAGITTALLSGGGEGIGKLEDIAIRMLLAHPRLQLVVMTGRNRAALKTLQLLSREFPGRLAPLGYTREVERVMACCDFAVIKPGGLTTAECLVMGLPMLLSSAIPGQEERNADFLLEQGVAWKAPDARTLEYRVKNLINTPGMLAAMRARARALGKEHAALHVLNNVQRYY